jgi:hypothetical protein
MCQFPSSGVFSALVVTACAGLGGCAAQDCGEHVLSLEPAPWFGGAERAKFVVCWEQRWASETRTASFRWRNGVGETVKYEDFAPALREFLSRSSLRRTPHLLDGKRPEPPFSYWGHGGLEPPGNEFLRPAWVIVALRPLVLLEVDCDISDVRSPDFRLDSNGGIVFPDGVTCSTRLPLVDEVIWISPDLNVESRRATRTPDGSWEIRLAWGSLVVRRDGDGMTVDAIEAPRKF